MKVRIAVGVLFIFVCGMLTGIFVIQDRSQTPLIKSASAQQRGSQPSRISPTKALADRDIYFPGTEDLKPDEMRITALGTGMPSARPKQAAACFLVELGNGDKFLFDIGSGSHERIAAQKIPYDYLDKVFIGHLHVDHFGDLPTFWLGGTVMNRLVPLRVWGPSGSKPELGTKFCMEKMQEMYQWDIATRSGVIDFRGGKLEVNEFPFDGINKVIYDENGVVIRSFPAIHGLDGAVSFILEWNGMKFVYGSDTYPNKWYIEHAAGADFAIHECFLPPTLMVEKQGFSPLEALVVGTQGHTSPEQFGKVMSIVQPRLAIGYHFYNDFDTEPEVRRRVRKTYEGPLSLAVDYMVWNVTKADIKVRMAAKDEEVWPSAALKKKIPPDFRGAIPFSDFTLSGREAFPEVVAPIYEEINEKYGTDFKPGL
ncbi:MAG: guanitoxin biosynthesis MBL fold metallo-hydrolase GntH [Pirellulaceae bacterium]|nr:guanitoxin biosynthesis MBL fold metallo-hydrolase GntH [Pirellulaceae bacterium]